MKKIKEKIDAEAAKIENRLEEFEKIGNEKLKSAADALGEYAEKKGWNTSKGKIIIVSAVILFFMLTGGIFKLSFKPFKLSLVNPITTIKKAFIVKRASGAGMPLNNIPAVKMKTSAGKNYQALALKIYKKVFKLDNAIQKSEVNSGYSPSNMLEISKLHKKEKKNDSEKRNFKKNQGGKNKNERNEKNR